jgi:hypothetical protein
MAQPQPQPQDEHNPQPQAIYARPAVKLAYSKATHYHGINAPDGQLIDSYDSLAHQANAGDMKAAASLYAGLAGCKTLSASPNKDNFTQRCAGITAENMASAGSWLELAAKSGNADAQYTYAAGDYEQIVGADITSDAGKVRYAAYLSTARSYLENLSHQCNVDAIAQISRDAWSNGPLFGGKGSVGIAYTYAVIHSEVSNSPDDNTVQAMEAKLPSSENVPELRRNAEAFVRQYCQ